MPIKKVSHQFNPWEATGTKPPKNRDLRDQILEDVAAAVKDYILERVSDGRTPISKGKWRRSLKSESYKAEKTARGQPGIANMEFDGDMLDALQVTAVGNRVDIRIEGGQAGKADGHNNHSGKSKLPAREFIPKEGQKFRRELLTDIREIIKEYQEGE